MVVTYNLQSATNNMANNKGLQTEQPNQKKKKPRSFPDWTFGDEIEFNPTRQVSCPKKRKLISKHYQTKPRAPCQPPKLFSYSALDKGCVTPRLIFQTTDSYQKRL